MIKTILAGFIYLFTFSFIQGQGIVDEISFFADITANAGIPEHRSKASVELEKNMEHWLSSDEFNTEDLEAMPFLSVKTPEDKSFYIVTWQLIDGLNQHSYKGYIISTEDGVVTKLNAENGGIPKNVAYETRGEEDWYGALYYNILETEVDKTKAYLLFGYDGHKEYEHRKVVDVLTFDQGKPIFGAEIFKVENEGRRDDIKNRIIIEYSNDANVSLNFKEHLDMITHDHLISRIGRIPGQGPTMLPDGSYIGYKWDGKFWVYIDKIYNQVSEEPPTDGKIRTAGQHDIFGKSVKPTKQKKRSK